MGKLKFKKKKVNKEKCPSAERASLDNDIDIDIEHRVEFTRAFSYDLQFGT